MILQRILFPKVGVCTVEELYYRATKDSKKEMFDINYIEENIIFNKRKSTLIFDTYFNSFSIEKWIKYTKLQEVYIKFTLKGKFKITLINKEKIHHDVFEKELKEVIFNSKDTDTICMKFDSFDNKGIYAFKIEALEEKSIFYGAEYFTEVDESELKDVNIAIDICTFRREKFIERNLKILSENLLNNPKSILYNHLKVYIADNGKTLDIEKLQKNNINIYPNKNVGGAGGFTRALIEILKDKDRYNITHTLIMDDDIMIEPASIEKTYTFLRLRKEEYNELFIGGSMLRLDKQYIQIENGAAWYAGNIDSLKNGLDLRECDAVIYNETEEYTEYNAWWYCCIPMSIVNENNLPLPIFIRGDDLEYGLRNIKNVVNLNGVCVWHEPFENKYTSFLHYYILRNMLIDNSIHVNGYSKWSFLKLLFKRITREMSYYRYDNVDLMYKAVEDFYLGIDWLKEKDGEVLHKEIMNMGYKSIPVEDLDIPFSYPIYEQSLSLHEGKIHRFIRFLTFNGYILPTKGNGIASMALARPNNFYRKRRVLNYDITSNRGFITKINRWKVISNYLKFINISFKTMFKFNKIKTEYKNRFREISNIEFWHKYLDI